MENCGVIYQAYPCVKHCPSTKISERNWLDWSRKSRFVKSFVGCMGDWYHAMPQVKAEDMEKYWNSLKRQQHRNITQHRRKPHEFLLSLQIYKCYGYYLHILWDAACIPRGMTSWFNAMICQNSQTKLVGSTLFSPPNYMELHRNTMLHSESITNSTFSSCCTNMHLMYIDDLSGKLVLWQHGLWKLGGNLVVLNDWLVVPTKIHLFKGVFLGYVWLKLPGPRISRSWSSAWWKPPCCYLPTCWMMIN